jgi:hypothetical protein
MTATTSRRTPPALFLLLAAAACATPPPRGPVPANERTVTARLEIAADGRSQQVVVQNASTEPIVVNGVILSECEHIRTRCETHRMNVAVGPGQRRPVLTVVPDGQNQGHSFRYTFSWQGSSARPSGPAQ